MVLGEEKYHSTRKGRNGYRSIQPYFPSSLLFSRCSLITPYTCPHISSPRTSSHTGLSSWLPSQAISTCTTRYPKNPLVSLQMPLLQRAFPDLLSTLSPNIVLFSTPQSLIAFSCIIFIFCTAC